MRHLFPKIILYLSAFLCFLRISAADAQENSVLAVQEQVTNLTVDLQRSAKDALRENERLSEENSILTLELKKQQEKVQELSDQVRKAKGFIDENRDLEKFWLEEKNAQRQYEELREHVSVLEKETASLRAALEILSHENGQQQSQVNNLKAQRQSLVEYQHRDLQLKDRERFNALSNKKQIGRERFDAVRAKQGLLAQKISSAQKGLALAQLAGSDSMDLSRYRQILRLMNLSGRRARPRCLDDHRRSTKEKYVFQSISAADIDQSLKDLETFSERASAHPAVLDPGLQGSEGSAYQDLFSEYLQWAFEQASRISKEYQDAVQNVIVFKQSAEALEAKAQAHYTEKKELLAQLKNLGIHYQDALTSLQKAQTADTQERQRWVKQKKQAVLDQGLLQKRIASLQEDVDRYDDLKKKALLSQEQRLQKVLSDLRTQYQVLTGKISSLQMKIARTQEEKKILEDVLGAGKHSQGDQKMKKHDAALQRATTSSPRKPEWKMPSILQE